MKLDIGLGTSNDPSYTTVDLYNPADIKTTMWDIKLPDGSVDEIYCKYALEHVPKAKVLPTLLEWKRLLSDHGVIIVQVPDMQWVCEVFAGLPSRDRVMDFIYGGQSSQGDFHMTGFTVEIMQEWVADAGLRITRMDRYKLMDFVELRFEIRK